jgi:hypothetical protein
MVAIPSVAAPPPEPSPTAAVQVYSNTQGQILASGVDSDGREPLMVLLDRLSTSLWVFVGGGFPNDTNPLPTTLPGASVGGHNRTHLTANPKGVAISDQTGQPVTTTFLDLFDGSSGIGFEPVDGIVFHGLIVLAGRIFVLDGVPSLPLHWALMGFGFAVSRDRGVTWSLDYYDTDENDPELLRKLWPRGQSWVIRVGALYESRYAANPAECYVSSTDYRHNLATGEIAASGHAWVLKFNRSVAPIGDWSAPTVARFSILSNTHCHVAQVTEFHPFPDNKGLQLLVSNGDGPDRNRFTRYILNDKDDPNFATNWIPMDDYHGTHAPFFPGKAMLSQQPVGAIQGPREGAILWGADSQTEWISMMQLPFGGEPSSFSHVYGFATGFGDGVIVRNGSLVNLKDLRPENSGTSDPINFPAPCIASVWNELARTEPELLSSARILFTPQLDSSGGVWTQIGNTRWMSPTSAMYGGYIYSASDVDISVGLRRFPVPEVKRFRPVLVAPGGANLVIANCAWVDETFPAIAEGQRHATVLKITGSQATGFTDPELPSRTLHPPCLCDQVLKLKSSFTDDKSTAGLIRISEDGSGGLIPWNPAPQVRRFRAWALDGSYFTITPNKTAQVTATMWPDTPGGERGSWIRYTCGWGVEGEGRWCPLTMISYNDVENQFRTLWIQLFGSGDREVADSNVLYIAIDQALDGIGSLSYPQLPSASGSPAVMPDERLTVTGVNIASNSSWLLRVSGVTPNGNWDHYAMRGSRDPETGAFVSKRFWPLLTLWGASNQYIELSANCDGLALSASVRNIDETNEVSIGGGQMWLPDSPLHLAIGFDSTTKTLLIGYSLGGDLVQASPIPLSSPLTLTEIRLRGVSDEVCEMRWIGGEIDDAPVVTPTPRVDPRRIRESPLPRRAMNPRRIMHRTLIPATALAAICGSTHAQWSSSLVADSSTPIPGGSSSFTSFAAPSFSNGRVEFAANLVNNNYSGVYSNATGQLQRVADFGTNVPGSSTPFAAFGYAVSLDGSTPSFSGGGGSGSSAAGGIFTQAGGQLVPMVTSSTSLPGAAGQFRFVGTYPFFSQRGSNAAFLAADSASPIVSLYSSVSGTYHRLLGCV